MFRWLLGSTLAACLLLSGTPVAPAAVGANAAGKSQSAGGKKHGKKHGKNKKKKGKKNGKKGHKKGHSKGHAKKKAAKPA
jgi:hypothetical protein